MGAPRKVKLAAALVFGAGLISATAAFAGQLARRGLRFRHQPPAAAGTVARQGDLHEAQTYNGGTGDFAALKSVMEPAGPYRSRLRR